MAAYRIRAMTMKGVFEGVIWQTRLIIVLAVIASLFSAIMLSIMATGEVFNLTWSWLHDLYTSGLVAITGSTLHAQVVAQSIGAVTDFLLAMLLFIMAWGLYELFISKLSQNGSLVQKSSNILVIRDLDDLKERVIKLVLLILVVQFFNYAIHVTVQNTLGFLYMGGGVLMMALALFLAHRKD